MDKLMNWLKWTGIVSVLLNFFLIGHAWYYDIQAKAFVDNVHGIYVDGTWEADGDEGKFLIQWDKTGSPPACPVTIHAVFTNNGYAVSDFGAHLDADDHHAVHLAKNGKISVEPVGHTAFNFVNDRAGTWLYKLEFTFHCSTVAKSTWFFWLNLDNTYTAQPVTILVNGTETT